MDKRLKIWVALLAVYIVWGSTYLAIRFAVQSIPPFLMVSTRFLVAGAILFGWRRLRGDPLPTRKQWLAAGIVGFLLLVAGNGSVVWAEQWVPSGITALIVGTAPLFMVLIDALRPGGQRPDARTAAGVLLGFGGIVILVNPASLSANPQRGFVLGLVVLFVATFFWAAGSLYSRKAQLPASALLGTGMEMLVGGVILLGIATFTGEWGQLDLAAVTVQSWLGLAYLIVFGALIGFVAYTWLLRSAPTPLVSTYAYVNPLIAIFLGAWLAQEALTPRILLAALVIVGAVFIINSSRARLAQRESAPELAPVLEEEC
jgi:drug/metabolite transporter (DMT)-like permease